MTLAALYSFRDNLKSVLIAVETAIKILEEQASKPSRVIPTDAHVAPAKRPKPIPERMKPDGSPNPAARPRNPDNVWEDWQIIKMVKMKGEGAPSAEIGLAVGKTPVQVNNKWHQHQAKLKMAAAGEQVAPPSPSGGADGRMGRGSSRRRTS